MSQHLFQDSTGEFTDKRLSEAEIVEIKDYYSLEKELFTSLASGSFTEEDRLLFKKYISQNERLAHTVLQADSLRSRKNTLLTRNTLCRISAAIVGVHAFYLHTVSCKYTFRIERAASIDYLDRVIAPEMLEEYAEIMCKYTTKHYAQMIREVVYYISDHLTENLSLSTLADAFHLNKSYLARKFKEDTGHTVIDYINQQRIQLAKLLLEENHRLSLGEVSEQVGFHSLSYFSRVFKKYSGQTAQQYLHHAQNRAG